ncbi:fused PTS fructose transporter subunit IIA/HPr protein [Vibrio sp. SCSIO 43136]|uniref:fused PTS fructose transporter subunit IIA/HPr protein n=1 Tax=Vibrio sp. SCSIO 43136 TaxID=2819101 RepID=UPI002074F5B4|nr:fused PTS fructose transporter subunit IIA/HPr protein [Vibrio sp. SCSIO 43136]USD67455.1 fused PTS fructose transporter subunit IIA/HPr protein [Vibrio sp. SCSIO 43136]
MLKLNHNDITLSQTATDKFEAIKSLAASLTSKGLVEQGYVEGMLNRENQNSTFLGNGIAIPHGTTDTRAMVKTTGVAVHHFPQGVDWGDGNTVYLAIGIAAKSDEHLGILKQLTKVLSADGIEQRLRQAANAQEIIALLNGDVQLDVEFNSALISQGFPATDMTQMSAVAAGLLKNASHVGKETVADLVTKTPTSLGEGLWLVSSNTLVSRSAISVVTSDKPFKFNDSEVKALVAIAACNDAHLSALKTLSEIVFNGEQSKVTQATSEQLLALFGAQEIEASQTVDDGTSGVFTIKNAHGLHARPGAMLVAEAKKFESNIRVSNLDGDGKAVNAKSLMKVIALGVKHGHKLQFTADGSDAPQAIESIGQAIAAGLGEG